MKNWLLYLGDDKMDKIKKYIECYIPTETCNFRCHYCYIAQLGKFKNKLAKFTKTPKEIREAFSKKRLGGTCLFNLCAGGETLLVKEIIEITHELLAEGHYVMVVTNGSLKNRFEEFAKLPKGLLNRLIFKFSFHYIELKRMHLLDQYFDNVNLMKKAGASIVVEITPNDETEEYIPEIKAVCMEKLGALPQVTIARNDNDKKISHLSNHSFEDFVKVWSEFDSPMLDFKSTIFYKKRKEYCYAGDWSIYVNLVTGEYSQCYCGIRLGNVYENIHKPLKFVAMGKKCSLPHCYNGHAFITLGDIPELDAITYAQLRNRISGDGSEWLTKEMKEFIGTKLSESNSQYSGIQKVNNEVKRYGTALKNRVIKKKSD